MAAVGMKAVTSSGGIILLIYQLFQSVHTTLENWMKDKPLCGLLLSRDGQTLLLLCAEAV